MSKPYHHHHKNRQQGAVIVLTALLLVVLLGFAALAVDIGYLMVVKNELQNAADAGALAGAGELYYVETGSPVPFDLNDVGRLYPLADQRAEETAENNKSVNLAVEVTRNGNDASSDVQIGHWSLKDRRFTRYPFALDSYEPLNLATHAGKDPDTLNDTANPSNFLINAVLVRTHRRETPAPSFFSRIFGYSSFGMDAEAVAYIGFGGSFAPGDFDWPIAICEESILVDGGYRCGQARLINSSSKSDFNTGGWTNYQPCTETTANGEVIFNDAINPFNARDLMNIFNNHDCDGSNTNPIENGISVGGGQLGGSFNDMTSCSNFAHRPNESPPLTEPWRITVPVVNCVGEPGSGTLTNGNINGCKQLVGAVTLDVVLITDEFTGPDKYKSIPRQMTAGSAQFNYDGSKTGAENWAEFVRTFNLQVNQKLATDPANSDAGYYQSTVYALPSCERQAPSGKTGGIFTGIPAEIPVLVKGSFSF